MKTIHEYKDIILSKEWNNEEKELIESLIDTIYAYRYLIPDILKSKIEKALLLCINLKTELDNLKNNN